MTGAERRYTWMAGSGPGHDALHLRHPSAVMPVLDTGIHAWRPAGNGAPAIRGSDDDRQPAAISYRRLRYHQAGAGHDGVQRPAGGQADNTVGSGWLLGVGQRGDIALNYSGGEPVQDNRRLPNGNVLFSETGIGRIYEMTRDGEIVRHWYIAGKWRDKEPPVGGIPIELPLTHHAINMLSNGNLLLMSAEVRTLDDWPGSETDPGAPAETANVVGDVIAR